MKLLIKEVELNGVATDIYIENKYIKQIGPGLSVAADKVIDGRRKAAIPGFVNTHTHAAMTLFRGFGDDMPLMPWLEEKIWPNEAKLTKEDVFWGAKLACLEMIKAERLLSSICIISFMLRQRLSRRWESEQSFPVPVSTISNRSWRRKANRPSRSCIKRWTDTTSGYISPLVRMPSIRFPASCCNGRILLQRT